MSEIQAKRGYLKVERTLKNGRKTLAQQECIISAGMMDARTVERELLKAADSATARGDVVIDGVVETFSSHEVAPVAWTPLMDRRTQESFAGFDSPYNQWQPDSPRIIELATRRKERDQGVVSESG